MRYISTRGAAPVLGFGEAMMTGLARDGGLYVPETVPQMTAPEIAIDEISSAYVHGIAGSSASGLYAFAQCVIRSDPDLRRDLAKYLPALRMTRTDQLIFPAQPRVAVLLRLAQLIVVLQTGSDEEIAKVWDAIWRERGSAETLAGPVKFEAMILTTLLISGIRI